MPIRPEFRQFYTAAAGWPVTRRRILERAGNICEQCCAPNGLEVWRNGGWWVDPSNPDDSRARDEWGHARCEYGRFLFQRRVRIVLTVAHLNHTPGDDRDENLRALCQWCHLNFDARKHKETRCLRKDRQRPLLQTA